MPRSVNLEDAHLVVWFRSAASSERTKHHWMELRNFSVAPKGQSDLIGLAYQGMVGGQ